MNDQIVQLLKKIFSISYKKIAYLLEKLIPLFKKSFRPKLRHGKKCMSLKDALVALFYKIKTGCPWRQIPECFGNWRTIYGWYRKVALANFFENFYKKLVIALQKEKPDFLKDLIADGTLIPAKNGGIYAKRNPRAQNKSVTNVMFLSNGKGLPLNFLIASGVTHDSQLLQPIFITSRDVIKSAKNSIVHADKGFDLREIRRFLIKNNYWVQIPYRKFKNRMYAKRPIDRKRGRIERLFARLKQFKSILLTFNRSINSFKLDIFIAISCIFTEKVSRKSLDLCFSSI
ncbi:MAG: Transposase [candidate division TM6 bacterium GW2011_GWE2_42_60]|nr:MAG: Transposase [candidate division TM6 bacterium GW2011_GWE2_42_60]HBY05437.1 IS5 family transposase [Candidatus Dependentiae bacterium]